MKKWVAVLIIIFVMIATLIALAIFSLFDYINEEDIMHAESQYLASPPEGNEFLEDYIPLVKVEMVFIENLNKMQYT